MTRAAGSRHLFALILTAVAALGLTTPLASAQPAHASDSVIATIPVGSLPHEIVFTPDGSRAIVANSGSRSLSIINVATNTVLRTVSLATQPLGLAVTPDGSRVWVVGYDVAHGSSIQSVGVASGGATTITTSIYYPTAISFVAGGQIALVVGFNGVASYLEVATGVRISQVDIGLYGNDVVVTRDGRYAYIGVGDTSPGNIYRIDLSTFRVDRSVWPGARGAQIDVSPDGSTLLVPLASSPGEVAAFNTAFDSPAQMITGMGYEPAGVAITPVGSHAYVTNPWDNSVSIIDVGHRSVVGTIPVGETPRRLAVSPSGTRVFVANYSAGTVSVISRTESTVSASLTMRLSGPDRYSTAVAISQYGYPDGAETVWVATGQNFPDALAAAAAAAHQQAPLLLVTRDVIPAVVRNELARLDPSTIVVVGGDPAIGSAVRTDLRALADTVVELAGPDRYQTGQQIVRYAFLNGGPVPSNALIATGANFPDALSGGGAAGILGAPMILVPGTAGAADALTQALIADLSSAQAIAVGGPPAISVDYLYSLSGIFWHAPDRISGGDRYTTSQNLNGFAFDTADVVYLATGHNFPDALAGAALAGAQSAPLYIVQPDCVPRRVLNDLARLNPSHVVLLGGPPALSDRVKALTPCG